MYRDKLWGFTVSMQTKALEVECTRAREYRNQNWSCAASVVTLAVFVCPPGIILQRNKFARLSRCSPLSVLLLFLHSVKTTAD